jgi:hypothetical protein
MSKFKFDHVLMESAPLIEHRHKRVLRRHITFFDFTIRALLNPNSWANLSLKQKEMLWDQGLQRWYT